MLQNVLQEMEKKKKNYGGVEADEVWFMTPLIFY